MSLRAKAISKKRDGTGSCLTYRGEAETQGDKVLPTPAKNLFSHHLFLSNTSLFSHLKEKYSPSVFKKKKKKRDWISRRKQNPNKTKPKTQLILSQAINHLKDLFGGAKLSEVAPGTIYHLSSCIFWRFQERSGMPRYIFLVRSKDCLHSSFARSCLKQKNADFHGSSRCYLDRSRLVRALLTQEYGIPPHFPPTLSKALHSTTRHRCASTNTRSTFWKSKIIFLPLFVFRIMAFQQAKWETVLMCFHRQSLRTL